MEKLSIIVPCFNEEEALPAFYQETEKVISQIDGTEFEYIFVDDGSRDGTLEFLRGLAARDSKVRYISFARNFGKEAAILAGLRAAVGDYTVLMDADLQDPPALLPDMLRAVREEGYDSAATKRITRKGESKLRSFFAYCFYKTINRFSDTEILNGARDYRLMTRAMTDAVLSLSEAERFTKGIFGWVGFKTKWIEYENVRRAAGKTKWSFGKLSRYAVGGIADFSTAPLNLAFIIFILSVAALIASSITCIALGGAPLALNFLIVSGVCCAIFAVLSVQSLYIAKIFKQIKNRPVYIIKETEDKPLK